ncbi:MAG: ISAs1 family transposase [Deltaproteobacteria bacterium]|nr:ISAs1 family transposase [Deltaproteobacteria bacterium]
MSLETQSNRAMAGFIKSRFLALHLDRVHDPRRAASTCWPLRTLVMSALVGIAASCRSLRQIELLTDVSLSGAMRRMLSLHRRIPDTTLRDFFCKLSPDSLRPLLHQLTRDAYRRKALAPDGLPFGVVALDGKVTGVGRVTDDTGLGQSVTVEEGQKDRTLIRTITACLVSAAARIVIDVTFVPAKKNEMSHFVTAFDELIKVYGRSNLFRVITYDAGATSKANAQHVIDAGKHYVFALKKPQQELWNEYVPQLESREIHEADAETVDTVSSNKTVTRRLFLCAAPDGSPAWEHLRTVLRVEATVEDAEGNETSCESRYFLSSLPTGALTLQQWLRLIRAHWGVENNAHHALDVQFNEDDHLFVPTHVGASLCLVVLRRVVLSLFALFRKVSLKSDKNRGMPWRELLDWAYRTLASATSSQIDRLRRRRKVALATS